MANDARYGDMVMSGHLYHRSLSGAGRVPGDAVGQGDQRPVARRTRLPGRRDHRRSGNGRGPVNGSASRRPWIRAVKAGNDILLISNSADPRLDLPERVSAIIAEAVSSGEIEMSVIEASFHRISALKSKLGVLRQQIGQAAAISGYPRAPVPSKLMASGKEDMRMTTDTAMTGGCQCGAVRYEITGATFGTLCLSLRRLPQAVGLGFRHVADRPRRGLPHYARRGQMLDPAGPTAATGSTAISAPTAVRACGTRVTPTPRRSRSSPVRWTYRLISRARFISGRSGKFPVSKSRRAPSHTKAEPE